MTKRSIQRMLLVLTIALPALQAQTWTATQVPALTPIGAQPRYLALNGATDGSSFGLSVSRLGDINGDGFSDVLVGAPYQVGFIAGQFPGQAQIRSGRNGAVITLPFPLNMIGTANGDELGWAAAGLPDIDADGVVDMIVGAPQGGSTGYARVISGGTGLMIALPPPLPTAVPTIQVGGFGYDVADAGDVNADGVNDYVVGAPFTMIGGVQHRGLVQVYDGATGANLLFAGSGGGLVGIQGAGFLNYLGISVASAGDWNGDGFDDIVAGAYNPNGVGFANVYSGAWISSQSGPSLLAVLNGNSVSDGFGISSHAAGDVNGDGLGDVIVGSYFGGFAEVFTGSTTFQSNPAPLYSFTGNSGFGFSVSGGLDVNADGIPDLIAGPQTPSVGNNAVYVFSGANGQIIRSYSRSGYDFGIAMDLVYDITGNGRAEVLIGQPSGSVGGISPGRAWLYFN